MERTSQRLPAAERREILLAAAARLFAERGYDGTGTEEIARAAGVSKPVLYRHFDSKKALYLALLRRHSDDLPGFVDSPAAPPVEGSGAGSGRGGRDGPPLESILGSWLRYAADNPHGWQMLFADGGGDEEIRAYRVAVSDRVRRVLMEFLGRAPGFDIPSAQLEPTAEILRGGLASMVLWWQRHPEVPRDRLVAAAARLVAGLGK